MSEGKEFVNYIIDMLEELGQIHPKYMFGDWGLYCNGIFFAIIADNTLFVKADDENRHVFQKNGLKRFSYIRQGKKCYLSYYAVPEEAIDDMEKLNYWAELGYQAAMRSIDTK